MKIEIYKLLNKSFGIDEIDEIVDLLKEQFGSFYRPFLYYVYEQLDNYLQDKENNIIENVKVFISGVLYDIIPELVEMCTKTLLAEFWNYKEKNAQIKSTGRTLYNEYYRKIEESDEIDRILKKYIVLSDIISNYLNQRIKYIKECIEYFESDKKDIVNRFGLKEHILVSSLRITSGDTHNKGRKVAKITLDKHTILYKPRSLETEHLFYCLLDMLCKDPKFRFRSLNSVSKNNHSWQEYAIYQEAETIDDIKNYYYRTGIVLFALDLLNSHDAHKENIIACKDVPIMIDMETLVDTGPKKPIAGDPPLKYINTECINTVIGTLLLPTNCLHMVFDFDISGLSGKEECESKRWYDYVLVNQGTDLIQLEKTYDFTTNDEEINLLRYKGQVISPQDYLEEFLNGYQDAYECFKEKKEEITQMFCNSTVKVRQVLRPTAVYAKFLQASLYSDYLQSKDKYNVLFEKFRSKTFDPKNEFEVQDLINRDVPYFLSEMGNNTLYSHLGQVEEYFENSSLSVILDKIDHLDDMYIAKQKYYIRLALSTLKNEGNRIHRLSLFRKSDNIDEILQTVANVMAQKMFWNEEKRDCYLITTTVLGDRRSISMLNYNIYDGGGLLLYYAGMYLTTKEEKYLSITNGLYNACISTKAINGFKELGVFVGKMSYVYLYYFLYKYLHFEQCKEQIESIRDEVYKSLDTEEVEEDIISGLAGIIILSAACAEDEKINGFDKLLSKAASMLAKRCEDILANDKLCKTGFAHGLSGIALAMYKAGDCLNEESYMKLAMRCVRKENIFFDESKNNWKDLRDEKADLSYWCYGSVGILLSRIQMQKIRFNKELEYDIERGLKSVGIQSGDTQCLCHGQFGNLNIMKILVDYYPKDKNLLNSYDHAKEQILNEIKIQGCLFGSKELLEDYSFMQGLSGMAYELLRLKNPILPNILALEV